MSAIELAAVLLAVTCLAVVAAMVVLVGSLRRLLVDLRRTLDRVEQVAIPAVEEMADAAVRVTDDLDRVDGLIAEAEVVSARADRLSRATYRAVADPVIKTAAVIRGTSRATRRLRRGGGESDDDQARSA